jgi:ankyrin repeat protein
MPRDHALSLILCEMICAGRRDVARALLLEPDIDVGITVDGGVTPLMLAAEARQPHLLTLILALGGDPNARDKFGRTALMRSAKIDDAQSVTWLIREKAAMDLATYKQHWTALMWAARYDSGKAARILLAAGANPGLRDRDNYDATGIAEQHGSRSYLDALRNVHA